MNVTARIPSGSTPPDGVTMSGCPTSSPSSPATPAAGAAPTLGHCSSPLAWEARCVCRAPRPRMATLAFSSSVAKNPLVVVPSNPFRYPNNIPIVPCVQTPTFCSKLQLARSRLLRFTGSADLWSDTSLVTGCLVPSETARPRRALRRGLSFSAMRCRCDSRLGRG